MFEVYKDLENKTEAPAIAMESVIVFPRLSLSLLLKKNESVLSLEEAMRTDNLVVFLLAPDLNKLASVGVIARISQALRTADGSVRVMADGLSRVKIKGVSQKQPYLRVKFEPIKILLGDSNIYFQALVKTVLSQFKECVSLGKNVPIDTLVTIFNIADPAQLADLLAFNLELKVEERQEILEIIEPEKRLRRVSEFLAREITILRTGQKLKRDTVRKLGQMSKEIYLREQLKNIEKELGISGRQKGVHSEYAKKLRKLRFPREVLRVVKKEIARLKAMPTFSPEVTTVRTYLDWLFDLPWKKNQAKELDIKAAAKLLDNGHFGLESVKERILEYLAVQKKVKKIKGPILCFVGPPGTGKTSIGRSIAEALGRKFMRVSLGGVRDEAEIRGHRRTYIGALPGRIIQGMKSIGTTNPVFMLDEIDKLGNDFRGDPSSALLEALDPEQNYEFSDHYLEVPYDLSNVMFITTANVLDEVPFALRDRLEVIRFSGFTQEEKMQIGKKYILPRLLLDHGLKPGELTITDEAVAIIIGSYTFEAGVRDLERALAKICRKAVRSLLENKKKNIIVSALALEKFLGPEKFRLNLAEKKDEIGVASGLAWTEAGGDVLSIEAISIPGKGNLLLTGSLGEVMQESAQAAFSFAKAYAKKSLAKLDIHLHVPSGAIPKDGPSAGVAMAAALVSVLSDRPIEREIAMTGEVTLRGHVLEVGGINEKILAAYRGGAKKVIMPKENKRNLIDIPKEVRKKMDFIFVDSMEQVLNVSLKGDKKAFLEKQ